MMGCCVDDDDQSPAARWLPQALGVLLVAVAGVILLVDWPKLAGSEKLRWHKTDAIERASPDFGDPAPSGKAERLLRYRITQGDNFEATLNVAEYQNDPPHSARAIVYPSPQPGMDESGLDRLRHDAWQDLNTAITTQTPANGLFLSWWDDAQRIAYGTGREVWADRPAAAAYIDRAEQGLWNDVAGGLAEDDSRLRQWARWLTMDATAAIAEMRNAFAGRSVYVLICLDDLARLGEIEALAGSTLPFEFKRFPPGGDLHGEMALIQAWASEQGTGSFFVQRFGNGETRAWRVATEQGAKTLLARLLPFSGSLASPLAELPSVYRSQDGAYLSVFQLKPAGP